MTRWLSAGVLLLLLAACAGGLRPPLRDPQPSAAYVDAEGPAIEVRVADIHPAARIREVRLEGPEGARIPGQAVARLLPEGEPGALGSTSLGFGLRGGSSGKVVPGVGLGWSPDGVTSYEEVWVILLPRPPRPPIDPSLWRIKVDYFDSDGLARYRRLPMPDPPRG